MHGPFAKERIIAPPDFNRWKVPPASIAIHLCIGSVYAWSIFNPALVRVHGVATSASNDWTLSQVVWVFTVAIVFLGLSAAVAGKWLEKVGPRVVGTVAACCWGGGFLIGGAGIVMHEALPGDHAPAIHLGLFNLPVDLPLWLLYLGYGVLGGCGLGLGYVSPVSTLIRWFPDRRGMATGMAIMGFGGGAMIGAPLKEWLIRFYYQPPEFLGEVEDVAMSTIGGIRLAHVGNELREVVVVGVNDVAGMIGPGAPGVYLVDTGTTGIAQTFFTLGIAYFLIMIGAAFAYRIPAPGWKPAGWTAELNGNRMITNGHVHIDKATRLPQFYLMWVVLCLNVTAGIGVLAVAKTMMTEIFGPTLQHVVANPGTFAATYVLMISVFNMAGRFFWASASDHIGRKLTYYIFFVVGVVLYLSIPFCARRAGASPSLVWLVYFYAATMLIFTMYGGGFATIPAYLADIFGTRHVGAIHGRLLTAWSTAGVLGPLAITSLRQRAIGRAIDQLMAVIDPAAFERKFNATVEQLPVLVEKRTVTIAKLMELAPAGTPDPSANLYNSTMVLMAALLVVALIANALIRPVDEDHHMTEHQLAHA